MWVFFPLFSLLVVSSEDYQSNQQTTECHSTHFKSRPSLWNQRQTVFEMFRTHLAYQTCTDPNWTVATVETMLKGRHGLFPVSQVLSCGGKMFYVNCVPLLLFFYRTSSHETFCLCWWGTPEYLEKTCLSTGEHVNNMLLKSHRIVPDKQTRDQNIHFEGIFILL